jgi:hypothetical protein
MIRKITSICLTVCLVLFASTNGTTLAEAHQAGNNMLLREKAELLGIGANVKVKLFNGEKVAGRISSIDDAGFTLIPEGGTTSRQISYNETSELGYVSKAYHASATRDAAEARRVIANLGIAKHIMVRMGQLKIHGQIRDIESDQFVILPDDKADPVAIAYQDVQQVGKNLGILSTIGLVVVVIVVIAVIAKVK